MTVCVLVFLLFPLLFLNILDLVYKEMKFDRDEIDHVLGNCWENPNEVNNRG